MLYLQGQIAVFAGQQDDSKQLMSKPSARALMETSEFSTAIKNYIELESRTANSAPRATPRYQQDIESSPKPGPSPRMPLLDMNVAVAVDSALAGAAKDTK